MLARLDPTPEGLSVAGAARRLERYGRNALPAREPPGVWRVTMRQILNPLIWQGPISRLMLSSVALRIVRESPIPVLTARATD